MKLHFTKMHGCGNDYIYFDCMEKQLQNPSEIATKLSDRHFGIGGDGIVMVCSSDKADAKMRMFNADGSEGKMCGNAIRCVGKFLDDKGYTNKDIVTIDTLSGIKTLKLYREDGAVLGAKVEMGKAELDPKKIPVNIDKEKIIDYPVKIDDIDANITCVSMGNPHCIVFCDDPYKIELEKVGPKFENDPIFPEQVNTEFVSVIDKNTLKMRVFERGSGETWGCGTGACAAVVAAVENGHCKKGEDVLVHLRGGDLKICYTDENVFMTGEAVTVFEGDVEV